MEFRGCNVCRLLLFTMFFSALCAKDVVGQSEPLQVSEGQHMTLEETGKLLPPEKMSRMIDEHLKSIREVYPEMMNITHRPKWAAGELVVSGVNQNTIRIINNSRYGPLNAADKMPGSSNSFRLIFSKPYHPARLSEEISRAFDIDHAEANMIPGDGNDVRYIKSSPAPTYYTYVFKMGWGECHMPGGCIYRHFWEFTVAQSAETLTVRFEKDYGSDVSKKLRLKARNKT
ncbi:hypothetical protein Ocin01_15962 [Orchesella cincta]|uniref:Secreted protein n=1 Tax=Orchesella cincta TaxID=48709 RepID=A0A1D2MCL4_ORCCI|nr:hypothetical protein Ocin01_15962 [Orchesella cincta]